MEKAYKNLNQYLSLTGKQINPVTEFAAYLRGSAAVEESSASMLDYDFMEGVQIGGVPDSETRGHYISRVARGANPAEAARLRSRAAQKRAIASDMEGR